jgi:hypothetical protein
MDNGRFLLILLISLIIIKLFCKDTLEGQTDQEPDDLETPASSQVVRLNTGTCENPITTNEECIAAATALGLDPPMWDSSPGLNTNYPNGCSIPHGTKAFFNTGTGEGVECGGGSSDADCICASANVASQETQPEDPEDPVECEWPQVLDQGNNVCVDAQPIADGTVATHQRCIEDSDCFHGRCAGPTGDPGCYGAYTCTGRRRPEHDGPSYEEIGDNATSRMGYCGGLQSASGNP